MLARSAATNGSPIRATISKKPGHQLGGCRLLETDRDPRSWLSAVAVFAAGGGYTGKDVEPQVRAEDSGPSVGEALPQLVLLGRLDRQEGGLHDLAVGHVWGEVPLSPLLQMSLAAVRGRRLEPDQQEEARVTAGDLERPV